MNQDPTHPPAPEAEDLRRLSAFLDGELPAGEARRLAERLANEAPLRTVYEELQTLGGLLGHWPAPPLADVRGAVMARVREDLARSAPPLAGAWRRWAPRAWAASWVLGGVLTGLMLWSGINHRIDAQLAAENMAQDMSMSMIMTENWTPPITLETMAPAGETARRVRNEEAQP